MLRASSSSVAKPKSPASPKGGLPPKIDLDRQLSDHMDELKLQDSKLVKFGVLGMEGSGRLNFMTHLRLSEESVGEHKSEQDERMTNAEMTAEVLRKVHSVVIKILDAAYADSCPEMDAFRNIDCKHNNIKTAEFAKTFADLYALSNFQTILTAMKPELYDEWHLLQLWASKIEKICSKDGYKFEGEEKVLAHEYKIRREHNGFVDYAFNIKGKKLDFSYPHQVKFKKWLPMFVSSIQGLLFFVDMGKISSTNSSVDFLQEGLKVFEKTLESLPTMPIFVVLSKYDLLEDQVRTGIDSSKSLSLSNFQGKCDSASDIAKYVGDQYKAKATGRNLQVLTLNGLDNASIKKVAESLI